MKIKIFALVLMSVLCSTVVCGQEERERQVGLWEKELPPIRKFETLEKLSDEFIKEHQWNEEEKEEGFRTFFTMKDIYPLRVHYSTYNSGQWDTLSDGTIVWRLAIIIPNKHTYASIQFDIFLIKKGTSVYVRNYSNNKRSKEYTSKHVDIRLENAERFKLNEPIAGYTVDGGYSIDTLVLEYYIPKHITPGVISLDHIYITIPAPKKDTGLKSSTTNCHVNTNCLEDYNCQLEKIVVI